MWRKKMIDAKGVTLTYQDGTKALKEFSLTIHPGELVFITGPSGSGKTSLLKLIMGMEHPTTGSVTVLGQLILKGKMRKTRRIRRKIGPVFQEFKLIKGRTAMENIIMGMRFLGDSPKAMKEAAIKALDRVGLSNKADTKVENLSLGEAQRVAIARAVARKPSIILADEPTGNLDHDNAQNILDLLTSFRDNKTAVIITTHATHLLEKYENASHIRIKDGCLSIERQGE
jgi:cell division transport system ATP-binding protein